MALTLSGTGGVAGGPQMGLEPAAVPIAPAATNTVVFDYTAILSGRSWSGMGASDAPVIVTYSFSADAQPYLADFGFTNGFMATFETFSASDQTMTRNAINQWANASGVIAIEAPAGQGDIQFGRFDFDEEPVMDGFDGYAFYPTVTLNTNQGTETALGGDVFVNDTSPNSVWLMLHEIGHALGFKHPFSGDPTLDPSVDNHAHTVMSYSGNFPGTLGTFDHDAVEFLYGLQADDGTHVASWSWNATTATLSQTGTSGADTIRGVFSNDIMSGAGGNDILFGSFGDDAINGYAGIDTIFGGEGNDTITGRKGGDVLEGGLGSDVFRYVEAADSKGLNYDTLVGFDALNADRINLASQVTAIGAAITSGTLSAGDFVSGLKTAADRDHLAPQNAVLFTPNAGDFAGDTFLVIDFNGRAGFQGKSDMVVLLDGAVHLSSLNVTDFF